MEFKLSFLLVLAACVQLCFGAAIHQFMDENSVGKPSDDLDQDQIAALQSMFAIMPDMKIEMFQPVLETINKFSNGTSEDEQSEAAVELVCLLLTSGTNNALKMRDCTSMFGIMGEKVEKSKEEDPMSSDITDADLAELEEKLRAKINSQQTEQIMKIMRKFHKDNTVKQYVEGAVDLVFFGLFHPSDKPGSAAFREIFTGLVKAQIEAEEKKELTLSP